jgi:hypothetical protein
MLSITVGILVGGIITIAILTLGEVLAESNTRSRKYARNWRVDR